MWEKQRREEREKEREMGKMVGSDQVDPLKVLREEMAEMSLRVEKLESVVLWEGSGCSSGSSGNELALWNGAWWIGTKARMNSASKRMVSRAVKQANRQDDEKLNRMMAHLKHEMRSENMSDTDHETTRRRNSIEQANNVKANVHSMCVSPGLDLLDLHSVPVSGQVHSIHDVSSRVCSDDLP